MAELLIYNKDHWMTELSSEQLAAYVEKHPNFMDKYAMRTIKGDIIEIKDDGHWTGKGREYKKETYAIVIVKGKTVEELKHLGGSLTEEKTEMVFNEELVQHEVDFKQITMKKFRSNIPVFTDKGEVLISDIVEKVI